MNRNFIKNILEKELQEKNLIYPFIRDLTQREKVILSYRKKGLSLQEIGDKFGITRERIRQIEEKAKRKLEYQAEIMANLVARLSENLFTEDEVDLVFDEYLSSKETSYTKRKLEWINFNKILWEKKK